MEIDNKQADLNFSYEFYPPRQVEQQRRLWRTIGCLETLSPTFFSVTYGALGSQSEASIGIVKDMIAESDVEIAAHLTCQDKTPEEMQQTLNILEQIGVSHIVALRGDRVVEQGKPIQGAYQYAEQLVAQIARDYSFDISVAAYPEIHPDAISAQDDLDNLRRKFDAGATRALTQYFYDCDSFLRFRDQAIDAGIENMIVPGILPIHDIDKIISFSERCGAIVPNDVVEKFTSLKSEREESRQYAVAHCVYMCERLAKEGINDFHFYTLNQSDLSYEVTRVLRGEIDVPESRMQAA